MAWLNFLDLRSLPVKEAEAVILPIPYEATTTYGAGTREGPEAILSASRRWSCGTRTMTGTHRPPSVWPPPRRSSPEVSGPPGHGGENQAGGPALDLPGQTHLRPGGRTHHHRGPAAGRADPLPGPDGGPWTPTPTCGRATTAANSPMPASCAGSTNWAGP